MKEANPESSREAVKGSSGNGYLATLMAFPREAKNFLSDVRTETRRVTWPSMKQIRATTIVVIGTVFFFGIYFAGLDWVFSRAVAWLLQLGG